MQVEAAPKSAMRGVIHYLLKQWPYLIRYLEYEQLEVSANRAEHNIKSFTAPFPDSSMPPDMYK